MNVTMIYRPNNRRLTWIAFVCAVSIHLGAIAIAGNKTKPGAITSWGDTEDPPIDVEYGPPPSEIETVLPLEQALVEDQEFTEENIAPRPVRPRKKMPLVPVVRSTGGGVTS